MTQALPVSILLVSLTIPEQTSNSWTLRQEISYPNQNKKSVWLQTPVFYKALEPTPFSITMWLSSKYWTSSDLLWSTHWLWMSIEHEVIFLDEATQLPNIGCENLHCFFSFSLSPFSLETIEVRQLYFLKNISLNPDCCNTLQMKTIQHC